MRPLVKEVCISLWFSLDTIYLACVGAMLPNTAAFLFCTNADFIGKEGQYRRLYYSPSSPAAGMMKV